MSKPQYRENVGSETFHSYDAPRDELSGQLFDADDLVQDVLSQEGEDEKRARAEAFARMGHSPWAEAMKAELRQELFDRAGKFKPNSVDRYPRLPGISRYPGGHESQLARHGFINAIRTKDIGPGTRDTINSILTRCPDDKVILACGYSTGWYAMPVIDFRLAVKRNHVRLTGQVMDRGSNPATQSGDGVYCVYFGRASGLAFRMIDP